MPRACDFFDLFLFSAYPTSCISSLDKAVILSEALRRSISNRGLYGAESKDPGDAYLTYAVPSFSNTEAGTWRPLAISRAGDAKKLNLTGTINPQRPAQTWEWKVITMHEKMYLTIKCVPQQDPVLELRSSKRSERRR
jgi:hypothetical protein